MIEAIEGIGIALVVIGLLGWMVWMIRWDDGS